MVVIRCRECGRRVSISPDDVGLWRRPDGCRLYRVTCPACGLPTEGCLEEGELAALEAAGARVTLVPEEAMEAHPWPPLTLDDLIDFHFLLRSPGWERQALGEGLASHGGASSRKAG